MNDYIYHNTTKIIFGRSAEKYIGSECKALADGGKVLLLLGGAISEKELEEKIRNVGIDEIRTLARSFSSLSDACICAVGKTAGTKFYNKVVSAGK